MLVVITGASSGIGKAAALAFAREGARLALCARHGPALREVAEVAKGLGAPEAVWRACDVTSEADVRAFAASCGPAVDVLVANAGVGQYGAFLDMPMEDVTRVLDTNLVGVLRTVHAFGPALRAAKGHVVVVGSQAGKAPVPLSSVYAASKWALTGWTRSARPELEADGVGLTLLSPGGVDTGFADRRLAAPGAPGARAKVPGSQSVEHVAKALVRAAKRRTPEVDLSLVGAIGRAANAVAPHAAARAMLKARSRR
ncbi:MAG: hypothetical protein QOE90_331 [Thermoplasmata archaeon]|jgi:short-subunit dehydrogenase|nr:hypothetical protein [Thermoplasmata archaeon]